MISLLNKNVNVGDIVRVGVNTKNEMKNPVSFDEYGKVVIFSNEVETGYAKITKVIEKEKYYLAEGKIFMDMIIMKNMIQKIN